MRILLTNLALIGRSGTEMYLIDLAPELRRRGHEPIVYAPLLGESAEELRRRGVDVVGRLTDVKTPDIIHGQHHIETMTALLHFPHTPAVYLCHDRQAWHDRPPLAPRICRYIAVDANCRERFDEEGIDPARTCILENAVDLTRFQRAGPLPAKPRRALLFSHYAAEHTHLPVVRAVCERFDIALDVIGRSTTPCDRPEAILGDYDIVFAKARCALEALAVGRAVVLCDPFGSGPMVNRRNWPELRPWNLGRRVCSQPLSADALARAVKCYSPQESAKLCEVVRVEADLGTLADRLIELYRDVLREPMPPFCPEAELRVAADYLHRQLAYGLVNGLLGVEAQRDHWRASAESAHAEWTALGVEYRRASRVGRALASFWRRMGW